MATAFASPHLTRLLLPSNPNPSPTVPARPPRRGHRFSSTTAAASPPPSRNGSSPDTEWCPVPPEQRPVNEYEALAASLPFSWAAGDLSLYCSRLALTGAAFALFVGLPVAAFGSRGGVGDGARLALGATGSGLIAVTLAVVRMYLGWAYVGNRLLSATVEYEETGWYDGQIWVKTPEVLARDRLLGSFSMSNTSGNGSDHSKNFGNNNQDLTQTPDGGNENVFSTLPFWMMQPHVGTDMNEVLVKLLENQNTLMQRMLEMNQPVQNAQLAQQHVRQHLRLSDFQRTNPSTFSNSVNPLEADDWLREIKRKLEVAQCSDEEKIIFAAHQLTGRAAA